MNKKLLLSLLLSVSVSTQCLGSAFSSDDEGFQQDTFVVTQANTSQISTPQANLTELVTENGVKYLKGCAKKAVLKEVREMITENAPGITPIIGAMYFYSGSEADKENYEGTLARTAGNIVKVFVEELGGEVVVELIGKLKPKDSDTLTEALIRACARKYASIRTNKGYSEMLGDTVGTVVSSVPYAGPALAAAGKTAGQYIDPEANSLTEAVMKGTKNCIANAAADGLVGNGLDDTGYKAQFDALGDGDLKEQIREKFKSKIDEYNEDLYAEYDPYEDMIKMYSKLENANHDSGQESAEDSGQESGQGSWWGFW